MFRLLKSINPFQVTNLYRPLYFFKYSSENIKIRADIAKSIINLIAKGP
jgi:hypothetical protein